LTPDEPVGTEEKTNIIIKEATRADNEGLVYLTSLAPMKGDISIRIDRRPDFFRLLEMRGSSFVMVAELNDNIIGSFSASAVNVFIDGKPETVHYLGDFKIHPDYRKSTVAMRLARAVLQKLISMNADLLFCTAAYRNEDVMPFFKGRSFLPTFEAVGIFNVLQIIPTLFKTRNTKYHLEEGSFVSSGVSFFNNFMKNFQFGLVYSESSFENTTLITASFNNTVVSAITLFDAGPAKQNVLIRLPFYLKSVVMAISALNAISPIVRLPKINNVVRILYIKSYACESGHEKALKLLIGRARNIAYEKKYNFLAIGIHENDPFLKIFSGYPKFTFKSMGFATSLKDNKEKIKSILSGIPFEDYSLV
jgi:predicted N-acetyltransferase YhbS